MKKKVFVSYSHKNEEWKNRVVTHLSVVENIDPWDDRRISGGADWYQEIEDTLSAADLAVLLVSADFLTSDFIKKEEIPRLLQRRVQEGLIVFPVIVYDCAWQKVEWLAKLNVRPKDGEPLSRGRKDLQESKLAAITKEVTELLDKQKNVRPAFEPGISSQYISSQCFIKIRKSGNSFTAEVHQVNPASAGSISVLRPDLNLNDNALVSVRGRKIRLGQVVKLFKQSFNKIGEKNIVEFDESFQADIGEFQLYIGQFLFDQLFPEFADTTVPIDFDLHISTSEEKILMLPWHVLSHKGSFLSASDWSVSFFEHFELSPCSLPDPPKILIAAPQAGGKKGSNTKAHLEAVENELSSRSRSFSFGQNLKAAYTWEEFIHDIESFCPDVIYFYGHCIEDGQNSKLCFVSKRGNRPLDIAADEFAVCIQKMSTKPVLIYLNSINTSTGLINFGSALSKMVQAVISSRFVYSANIAQEQGLKLLCDILTRGIAPHKAVTRLFSNIDSSLKITTAQARWMTPIIFRQYDKWSAKIPETPSRKIHDPFWHLKIDRVTQFSTVAAQTMQMVREGRPRSHVFVWYGTEGQGITKFHQRLNVELREYLSNFNAHIHEVRLEWPDEFAETKQEREKAFEDKLIEALEVNNLDDIPSAVRNITSGASGKQTLVYFRHLPVKSSTLINPKTLKIYIDWWDKHFVPLLERNQFALLGISFIVKNPPKFRKLILEKEKLEDLHLKHSVFRLLDEMEQLAYRDIVDFFKTHNIHLPIKDREKIIERILEKTRGHYEQTVKQLQILVEQSWDLSAEEDLKDTQETDDYDY